MPPKPSPEISDMGQDLLVSQNPCIGDILMSSPLGGSALPFWAKAPAGESHSGVNKRGLEAVAGTHPSFSRDSNGQMTSQQANLI